ncbi:hypothetical protein PYCCODRAFT_1426592 [Trametes coccinea BRFM310]|uniref:Uncharacterized protein n=1 Tax=Trametes coccinea (strain BRFM310) TaxID=1353009 RepID=A0A1Y2IGT2_TRAC3|nr:hypothetical protein PYCCODRAFT_1426592 [Trametes coccinea BRFM310]
MSAQQHNDNLTAPAAAAAQQQLQQQQLQQQQQQLQGLALAPGENNTAASAMGQGPMETDHQAPQMAVAPPYGQAVHVGQQPQQFHPQAAMQFASLLVTSFVSTAHAAAPMPILPPACPRSCPSAHRRGPQSPANTCWSHTTLAAILPQQQMSRPSRPRLCRCRQNCKCGSGGTSRCTQALEGERHVNRELCKSQESADRRAICANEAQKKNDQLTETCKDLRQQIHKLKDGVWECKKNRVCLLAELEVKDRKSQSMTEPAYPKHACKRDLREESQQRCHHRQYAGPSHSETGQLVPYSSWNAGPPFLEAGPSRFSFWDTTSSVSTCLALQPIEADLDNELVPMLPPAQFGPNNSSIWDEEAQIEYAVIDEDHIKRLIACLRDRRARCNLPPPATGPRP